jgi:peptidyl-tRNA hydrolase
MNEPEPILYILMRKDLPSMNAGKAMAQASHASNAFVKECPTIPHKTQWQESTRQGFGTVLVLAADIQEIADVVAKVKQMHMPCGVVVDPSYPYRVSTEIANLIPAVNDTIPRQTNGDTTTLWRSETTCAYVFGTKENLAPILGHLPLHP